MNKPIFFLEPKNIKYLSGICDNNIAKIELCNKTDSRISDAIENHLQRFLSEDGTVIINIDYKNNDCSDLAFNQFQGYTINVCENKIDIIGESAQGAFYGIITLSQLLQINPETLPCMEITDAPDMNHRGLYFDVARGRIPKIDKFKQMINKLAICKINSLQLYVEHTFKFSGFEEINNEFGYLTAEEIKEISNYCNENFIDCVPSLATFGHMYVILQNEKYKHLCELENYQPEEHIWEERMHHHTIDFANPESFEFVCKLIDEFLPAFNSKYFNICGDETFDLAKGRNLGKDSGEAYIEFITKIIDYVISKDKIPMMWGDVILKHPDKINLLPKEIIMLNWSYDPNVEASTAKIFAENGYRQLMCPGLNEWSRFAECINLSKPNIIGMAENGFAFNAEGILNTCWGDNNHTSTIENSFWGIAFGASKAWNVNGFNNNDFSICCSKFIYGSETNLEAYIASLETIKSAWGEIRNNVRLKNGFIYLGAALFKPMDNISLASHCNEIKSAVEHLEKIDFDPIFKSRLITAGTINYLFFDFVYQFKTNGNYMETYKKIIETYEIYRKNWLDDNKLGELETLDEYMSKIPEMFANAEPAYWYRSQK